MSVRQVEEYRARAKWAEDMAAQIEDALCRASWLVIADSYRELADDLEQAEKAASPKP